MKDADRNEILRQHLRVWGLAIPFIGGSILLLLWAAPAAIYNFNFGRQIPEAGDCQTEILPGIPEPHCDEVSSEPIDFAGGSSAASTLTLTIRHLNLADRELGVDFVAQVAKNIDTSNMALVIVPLCKGTPCPSGRRVVGDLQPVRAAANLFDATILTSTIALPLRGDPRQYPSDWYVLEIVIQLWTGVPDHMDTLPVDLRLSAASGVADYNIFLLPGATTAPPVCCTFRLLIGRNGYQRVAVYSVLLMPLILVLMLVYAYVLGIQLGPALLLPMAATLLAIFPLHSVLVPPDVPGFSRVDYVLLYEALFLVAVSALTLPLVAKRLLAESASNQRTIPDS